MEQFKLSNLGRKATEHEVAKQAIENGMVWQRNKRPSAECITSIRNRRIRQNLRFEQKIYALDASNTHPLIHMRGRI